MTLKCHIDADLFSESLMEELRKAVVPCQAAMANRFATVVNHNFGQDGEDRPDEWPPLKARYAATFHGGDRTPTLQLSGELQSSIEIEENNPEGSSVFTQNSYSAIHQWGDINEEGIWIPPRPFFPITAPDGESVTEYTTAQCLDAAKTEFERVLA